MPLVEFEPMIPAFDWAKTVHALDALDRAVTVIGIKDCKFILHEMGGFT
jgi:hypothetical protein